MADERVSNFLKNLDIKTVKFGGFDKTATFEALKALSDLYETILAEHRRPVPEDVAPVLQVDAALKDAEISRLKAEIERLKEAPPAEANRLDEFNRFMAAFKEEKERQNQNLEAERETILNAAREEGETILNNAKIAAMREKSSLADELEAVRQERKAIYDKLYLVQEQIAQLIQSGKRGTA